MNEQMSEQNLGVVADALEVAQQTQSIEQMRFLFAAFVGAVAERPGLSASEYLTAIKQAAKAQGLLK